MKISYENTMHELQKEQDKVLMYKLIVLWLFFHHFLLLQNVSLSMDLKEELAEVNRAFEKEKLNLTRELASLKEDLQLSANELKEKEEALVVAGVKIKEINQMVRVTQSGCCSGCSTFLYYSVVLSMMMREHQ